jgi:hypothetical protein
MIAHSFKGRCSGRLSVCTAPRKSWTTSYAGGSRRRRDRRGYRAGGRGTAPGAADLNYRNLDDVPAFSGRNDHRVPGACGVRRSSRDRRGELGPGRTRSSGSASRCTNRMSRRPGSRAEWANSHGDALDRAGHAGRLDALKRLHLRSAPRGGSSTAWLARGRLELDAVFRNRRPPRSNRPIARSPPFPRTVAIIDSLALGAMARSRHTRSTRIRLVALVHLPLAADIALDPGAPRSRRRNAGAAAAMLVSSPGNHLPPCELAPAGSSSQSQEATAIRAGFRHDQALSLLSVATIHRKGHEMLLEAYRRCRAAVAVDVRAISPRSRDGQRVRATSRGGTGRSRVVGRRHRRRRAGGLLRRGGRLRARHAPETYGMAVAEAGAGLPSLR